MSNRSPLYKIGSIQRHRRFPDGYESMTDDEKKKVDSEFYNDFKLPPNIKSKHFVYYAEIIWDDEMYVEHTKKTNDFIVKAKKIHGDLYDYSKVNYLSVNRQIEIVCDEHGSFFQRVDNHLQGKGCETCGFIKSNSKKETETKESKQEIKKKKQASLKNKESDKAKKRSDDLAPTLFDILEERKPKTTQIPILAELMEKIEAKKKARLKEKRGRAISEGKTRAKEMREQAERVNRLFLETMEKAEKVVTTKRNGKKVKRAMKRVEKSKPEIIKVDENGIRPEFYDFLEQVKKM